MDLYDDYIRSVMDVRDGSIKHVELVFPKSRFDVENSQKPFLKSIIVMFLG